MDSRRQLEIELAAAESALRPYLNPDILDALGAKDLKRLAPLEDRVRSARAALAAHDAAEERQAREQAQAAADRAAARERERQARADERELAEELAALRRAAPDTLAAFERELDQPLADVDPAAATDAEQAALLERAKSQQSSAAWRR